MHKLIEVEQAKTLMSEASEWSIWKWLTEKRRVRQVADRGTEALNLAEKKVKAGWHEDLHKAYRELEAQASLEQDLKARHRYEKARDEASQVDPKIKSAAKRVKDADDVAEQARIDAEATFDEAERRLSAGMAREGALLAIEAYDLHETAIRKAEIAARLEKDI